MAFGINVNVATGSNVANRAENEARSEESRYRQQEEAIPSGMGIIPAIAKSAAPVLGEVVKQANNMESTDTLSQVVNEAATTGLLTEQETKLISNQMGTPEGNASAQQLLLSVLPARRADQKAVEWIGANFQDKIAEFKRVASHNPKKRQELVNQLVNEIQLESASLPQAVNDAIRTRIQGMFGVTGGGSQKGGLNFEQRVMMARLNDELMRGRSDKGVVDYGKKKGIQVEASKDLKDYGADTKTIDDARKSATKMLNFASPIQTLHATWTNDYMNEEGNLELVGFTPRFLSSLGELTVSATVDDGTPGYKELKLAQSQQSDFFTFLNQYLKELSGAAVTSSESMRVLRQFGLGVFAEGLIPSELNSMDINKLVKAAAIQDASKFTPDQITHGLNALGKDLNNRREKTRDTFISALVDEGQAGRLEGIFVHTTIPMFAKGVAPEGDYSAIDAKRTGEALGIYGEKAATGTVEALKNVASSFLGYKNKPTTTPGLTVVPKIDGKDKPTKVKDDNSGLIKNDGSNFFPGKL